MRYKAVLMAVVLVVSLATPAMAASPAANGTVSITAAPASDGGQFDYKINDEAAVSNLSVEVTGVDNVVDESRSGTVASTDSSISLDQGGASQSDPTVDLLGLQPTEAIDSMVHVSDGSETTINVSESGSAHIDTVSVTLETDIDGAYSDVDLSVDGTDYRKYETEGTGNKTVTWDVNDSVPADYALTVSEQKSCSQCGLRGLNIYDVSVDYDPSPVSVNGEEVAADGSTTVSSSDISMDYPAGRLAYNVSWTETTPTRDPTVDINGQTVGHSGTLADGETTELSVNPDWIESGRNNISISTSSPADGPQSLVGLDYQHTASRTINTAATSTQFESRYNVSHRYRNETQDATVLLPFDSSRIVEIHNLEYRLNGGSWNTMADSDYQFDGSEIHADISAAYGGELPTDTTVDVRSTGRKIEVENGAVTVTEATAPGDELDTKLRVDSKSDGFQINVGPTESGSRVHYGLSDDFGGNGPDGSAVIEANGDQHVQFGNALAGDSVRMKHLKTQVIPQSGDVRIEVKEAGSDPEIDVSPGPGGEGDPVDIKYYATQSGTEYILESLTQGIVLDSDVANSPAIFTDDDSSETWLIGLGSVGGDGSTDSDSSGIVGPIQSSTGFEIPFGGPLPAIAALLGLGLTATVYFSGRDGFGTLRRVGSRAGSATRSSIPVIGGVLGRLVSGGLTLLSLGGSGLVQLARFLRARPTLGTLVTVGLVLAAVVSGVVPVPQGTTIAIFAVAVPLVSFVVLRRLDQFSPLVWGSTSAIGLIVSLVLLGVEFGSLINEQTSLILAVGGLWLAYQAVQAYREGNITNVVIPGRRGGDGQ